MINNNISSFPRLYKGLDYPLICYYTVAGCGVVSMDTASGQSGYSWWWSACKAIRSWARLSVTDQSVLYKDAHLEITAWSRLWRVWTLVDQSIWSSYGASGRSLALRQRLNPRIGLQMCIHPFLSDFWGYWRLAIPARPMMSSFVIF